MFCECAKPAMTSNPAAEATISRVFTFSSLIQGGFSLVRIVSRMPGSQHRYGIFERAKARDGSTAELPEAKVLGRDEHAESSAPSRGPGRKVACELAVSTDFVNP